MKKSIFFLFVVLSLFSCKKEEEANPIPEITLDSVSETIVQSFENTIEIRLSYKDETGDIGYQDPDTYSLRIKDSRLSDYDWYHVPPLTPNNEELNIEGSFTVSLTSLFLLGSGDQETTILTLQLKDRAGNWSNVIQTPDILIVDSL